MRRAKPAVRRTAGGADEPVIRTRRLTKRYGTLTAVDNLDLEVHRGEIFGLLGQNGAGKTTTILMLLGLTEPTSGEARVMGLDPEREPRQVKRRVGYLPDAVGFYGGLTGRQNLRYTANLNGLRRAAADRRWTTSSSRSACPTGPTIGSRRIRAGCASASASPMPWSRRPICSSSTSRRRPSTRSGSSRSSTCSGRSSTSAAWRSCCRATC